MTQQTTVPTLLTRQQAQDVLHISRPTFDRLRREGKLKTVQIAQRRYVLEDDLVAYILSARDGAQGE